MSTTSPDPERRGVLQDPPEFELTFQFDDPENPTEVTVFPDNVEDEPVTEWISIESGYALPVEETR